MTSVSQRHSFKEKIGLLREVALFAGLSEVDMQAIGHATTTTHCVRGSRPCRRTTRRVGYTSSRRVGSASTGVAGWQAADA
jgi:hypothetical protein